MRKLAILVLALLVSSAGNLQAQSTNATLTGRVIDSTKANISDAKVTLINDATNLRYVGTTNETGSYYVTDVPAGIYRLEIEKPGFKTVTKPDIFFHVQDAIEVNFEMAVGSVSESINVQAGAPTVQLATSSVGAVVDSIPVRELPLDGRSWTDLANLQPGVAPITSRTSFNQGHDRGIRGFGDQ